MKEKKSSVFIRVYWDNITMLYKLNFPCVCCRLFCRGADKSLVRPTSRCILFDGENISFDAGLAIYGVAQKKYTLFTHQYLWNKFLYHLNLFQRY